MRSGKSKLQGQISKYRNYDYAERPQNEIVPSIHIPGPAMPETGLTAQESLGLHYNFKEDQSRKVKYNYL